MLLTKRRQSFHKAKLRRDRQRRAGGHQQLALEKYALIRSIVEDSFFEFVKRFWPIIINEVPVWNWHIRFICDELQKAADRVFKGEVSPHDYIINIPPSTTKSTLCSVMFPAWILARMPTARIICASHTEKLTHDLSTKARMIVESELYRNVFPQTRLKDDQNAKGYWVTTKNGFRLAATVGSNPMGFHGHFLIVDDPIDPTKSLSEAELKAANDFMNLTVANRKVDHRISVTFLIMQRLHQNDPTGNRLANKKAGKVRHICLPAEVSEHVKPGYCKQKYVDGLLDPIRLPKEVLEQKKSMGVVGYSGQYRQFPVPAGGGMFKTQRIKFDHPPTKFKRKVRFWDKAGTAGGGAYTAGVLLGLDFENRIWVLDVVRDQWDAYDREEMISQTARLDGKLVIIGIEQEPGSGGKESATKSAQRLFGYKVVIDRVTGPKEERADAATYPVGCGNVYMPFPERAPWVAVFLDEMRFFPDSTYKDQIDAFAGAFKILSEPIIIVGGLG